MEIKPFKAFRFDAAVVGDVGNCLAPPYDVISPAQQQQLYEKSRYNIVRITRGKTAPSDNGNDNQYTRAAGHLNDWIQKGALKQDSEESIYGYVQDFRIADTEIQRLSFIALAKLEDFGQIVRPHEMVLNEPLVDRLRLKKATSADFGLVFMLYEDNRRIAEKIIKNTLAAKPLIDFLDEQDVRHRLFAITARKDIDAIAKMMKAKSCIIADGHHRYTTGLDYSKESKNPAAKYQMLAFANTCQDGLLVLATHRLLAGLKNFRFEKLIADLAQKFDLTPFEFAKDEQAKNDAKQKMLAKMKAEYNSDNNAFGIYGANGSFYVAVLKDKTAMDALAPNMSHAWRRLDVSILHKLVLQKLLAIDDETLAKGGNLQYVKDAPNALDDSIAQVDAGQKQAAFFMNLIKLQQLKMVTDAGERMPQKSTYFYPKMYAGLTINKL